MGYRALPFTCFCGEAPDRILEVGLTSDHSMVVHFWCSACSRVVFSSKSLDECAAECPKADVAEVKLAAEGDARFLESIGILAE
jgi:hypothetical protein